MKSHHLFIFFLWLAVYSTGCTKTGSGFPGSIEIFVPNIISITSPENNIFYVFAEAENPDIELMVVVMEIYDRYGNPMFTIENVPPNDTTFGWDGTYEREPVITGAYSYSFRIGDSENSNLYVGDFTVVQ